MAKLILLRGLPGSGKTTYANRLLADAAPGSLVRIGRDPLARMLHNGRPHDPTTERQITAIQHAAVEQQLRAGVDVVVDDCNLRARYVKNLAEIAWKAGADVEVVPRDVPVDNCVIRDLGRLPDERVGEQVIRGMAQRYLHGGKAPSSLPVPTRPETPAGQRYVPDPTLPRAVMIDIDGTVALHGSRDPYDTSRYHEDSPNEPVIAAVRAMVEQGAMPLFCSGRDEKFRLVTATWLEHCADVVPGRYELHMRPEGDKRRDDIVKLELFDKHIRYRWNVVAAWDDRDRVVRAYRDVLGLTVFQVADGAF